MTFRIVGLLCVAVFLFSGCNVFGPTPTPPPTAASVNLDCYLGTWYEIASRPNRFQAGCTGTSATYSKREDGDINVENVCHDGTLDGPIRKAHGHAWVPDPSDTAKLKVSFFWPFRGDYWILDLDPNYQWALVGTAHLKYFWILSRTPTLDPTITDRLMSEAKSLGYQTDEASLTLQPVESRSSPH